MKKIILCIILLGLLSAEGLGCSALVPSVQDDGANKVNGQKITLSVLDGQSTSDAGIEDMIDSALDAKCPDISLEWECVDWGEKFASQMNAKFAAGEVPDIMIGKAQDVATYVPTGNLAPLSGNYLSYILDESLPAVTVDGKIYGLPYNALYQGVLYNKDIFKLYNLEVPHTINDMKNIINVLHSHGITPFAAHYQELWYIGNITMQFALNDVFNRQPDWGDKLRIGQVSFETSPEFRNCFQYNMDIFQNTWPDAKSESQADSDTRFAKGEAAMYVTGTWSLQAINEVNPSMHVGMFPYPNQNGDSKLIFEPNITFMKSAKTQYGDAVDRVFEAIFSDKDLAVEIFNFTKTASMLKGVSPTAPNPVQTDIDGYVNAGKVADSTVGNTQLIWAFQEDYSKQIYSWLLGSEGLDDALKYADETRQNSISK